MAALGALGSTLYFTPSQKATYARVSSVVKEIIQRLVAYNIPHEIAIAKLVLQMNRFSESVFCQQEELFFTALLAEPETATISYLEKVLKICEWGGYQTFFSCVSTKKASYYSSSNLVEIINLFDSLSKEAIDFINTLVPFPPYDEEGKDWLLQIKSGSYDLSRYAGHPAIKTFRPLEVHAGIRPTLGSICGDAVSFSKIKEIASRYLSFLPETQRAPFSFYSRIYYDIQIQKVQDLFKATLVKLVLLVTSRDAGILEQTITMPDLQEMLKEAFQVYTEWGEETVVSFSKAPGLMKAPTLKELTLVLKILRSNGSSGADVHKIQAFLRDFETGRITDLHELITHFGRFYPQGEHLALKVEENFETLVSRFAGEDPNVLFPIERGHLETIIGQYRRVQEYCILWHGWTTGQLIEEAGRIREKIKTSGLDEATLLQVLAIGRLAIYRHSHHYLYSSQILTILGKLSYGSKCIAQVKTGEGKSKIVMLLAFVLAIQDKSIHIISSSKSLAKRDQLETFEFFKSFKIKTSCISTESPGPELFKAQILYGTGTDFEFALMREMLYGTPLFEQPRSADTLERFDAVIIDELDNLTIDTSANGARLGYPAERSYEWVYVPIYNFVKTEFPEGHNFLERPLDVSKLKRALFAELDERFREQILAITDKQWNEWVKNAHEAMYSRKENKAYIVAENPKDSGRTGRGVFIVDAENTGKIMWGCRWTKGMHEFVEIKHHIVPEKESLIPISISHPVYYQSYRSLFGLTGTLGKATEREEIKEIYGASSFDVPTYKPMLRIDRPVQFISVDAEHQNAIIGSVLEVISKNRAVLVLCETISESIAVEALLTSEGLTCQMLNELQKTPEEEILSKAGLPGAITIATNNAGRGTDIKLDAICEENGGLHVLITFYPSSKRVEDQARGRAGRQGQKGSSEILVSIESLKEKGTLSKTHDLPKTVIESQLETRRDYMARFMKNRHFYQAMRERYLFSVVTEFYNKIKVFDALFTDEAFLSEKASLLSVRKLTAKPALAVGLSEKDRAIADEALSLFLSRDIEVMKWRFLLKAVGARIKDKMLNLWSVEFYARTQEQFSESLSHLLIQQQTSFQELAEAYSGFEGEHFHNYERVIFDIQRTLFEKLQASTETLYREQSREWDAYLDPSGSGVIEYLRAVTKARLLGL